MNAVLRRVSRLLVPLNYSKGERFDHDPALKFGPVPRLEAAATLASAPADRAAVHQSRPRPRTEQGARHRAGAGPGTGVSAADRARPVAIVTGGSRGIGAATARLLASRGYAVGVNYVTNEVAADAVVASIRASGGDAIAVQADVGVEADVMRLFATCDAELGRLSVLVNNAGILETQGRVDTMDAARLQRVLTANVVGSFLCAREAVRRMSTRWGGAGGAIVNLSSVAASTGSPGEYVDYAAAKGAIDTFTRGLAQEVAQEGIRVNAVRPGFIYTDIHASGGEPNRVDRVKAFVPMRRGGTADEVAQAIVWLLSDEASFTTGVCLDVAGGR